MADLTFGSFGDIITICQIVYKTVEALDDSRGSAADYQALAKRLQNLEELVTKIGKLSSTQRTLVDVTALDNTLANCKQCLNKFQEKILPFRRALLQRGARKFIGDAFRKIQWTSEKDDVNRFHAEIGMYIAMLQALLQFVGFELNAAENATIHRRISVSDVETAKGFAQTASMLENILQVMQTQGHNGPSNAAVGVTSEIKKLERRATELAEARETSCPISQSYQEAVNACREEVHRIVKESRRMNKHFVDHSFDIDYDLRIGRREFLASLDGQGNDLRPGSDIFDRPCFSIGDGFPDAICTVDGFNNLGHTINILGSQPDTIERCGIARDEVVGVYGFVFYRDGDWFPTVVDGRLYLEKPEFSAVYEILNTSKRKLSAQDYQNQVLSNSQALYFTASSDPQETWVPLLEKAFARSHGDYGAIKGLYHGDTLEDMTGGITTDIDVREVLDFDKFWREDLSNCHNTIVFAWNFKSELSTSSSENGAPLIFIMLARDIGGQRLIKYQSTSLNSWTWRGAWSDGSQEWTPDWMMKLDHKFGDEGAGWISYRDFLMNFGYIGIHRSFTSEWEVAQLWAAFEVPWGSESLTDEFIVTLDAEGGGDQVVIVISQPDSSYFRGLEGEYSFDIGFQLYQGEERIVSTPRRRSTQRSNPIQLELESNVDYRVCPRVVARRLPKQKSWNDVVAATSRTQEEKLLKVAYEYDVAHAKAAGWRAINDEVQQKKANRLKAKAAANAAKQYEKDTTGLTSESAGRIHSEDVLGYDDWDAVAALGLRVFTHHGKATIRLSRSANRETKPRATPERVVQPPPSTTLEEYESDEALGDDSSDVAAE